MITRDRRELRALWERFTSDGDATALLKHLRDNPRLTTTCGHEFPHLHRICDIILEGIAYRLTRCSTCDEELIFKPIPREIATDEPGVPFWLKGTQLRGWVRDQLTSPTEGPTDWEQYKVRTDTKGA